MCFNVLVKTKNLSREDWLAIRKTGIGGSDVGAICGVNKWKSAIALYLDKAGLLPENEDNSPSEAAYWGTTLEDLVAKEFTLRTGKKVRKRNAILQSTSYPFMLANLDREIIGENAILECKTVSEYGKDDWKDDSIPWSYTLQCQHYMFVGGYETSYIACLIGGNKFIWKEIPRDEEIINYIIKFESDFWINNVLAKVPPKADGSESSDEALKYLYPTAAENTRIELASEEYLRLFEHREKNKNMIEALTTEINEIENEIKSLIGENEAAFCSTYNVTWKNTKGRTTIDADRLKKDLPDIFSKYKKVGEGSRTLRITKKEGK